MHTGGLTPWVESQKLLANDSRGDATDHFGFSVAVDASIPAENSSVGVLHVIVVGGPYDEGDSGASVGPGGIHLFQMAGDLSWGDKGYFTITPGAFSTDKDQFGWSVDIEHDGIIVGAPEHRQEIAPLTFQPVGAAYFLQRRTG
jgi:hypothetical protein